MRKQEKTMLPNLSGTNFVKLFRGFLLTLIETTEIKEDMLVKKAYLEKNVKPETTRKYIKELLDMNIIVLDDKKFLHISE